MDYSVQFDQYLEFKTNQSLIDDLTLEVLDGLVMPTLVMPTLVERPLIKRPLVMPPL